MYKSLILLFVICFVTLTGCDFVKRSAELSFHRFRISTPSMEPNLKVGEVYSVVSVDSFRVNQFVAYHPLEKLRIENPDVIYISRLVGLPGDYLEMESGKLFLNGKDYPYGIEVRHSFEIEASMPLNEQKLEGMEYFKNGYNGDKVIYTFNAAPKEIQILKGNKAVLNITPLFDKNPINDSSFPVPFQGITVDTWGPVHIPSSNDTIVVTEQNKPGLEILITEHEKGMPPAVGDKYIFRKNYYFVISDNRHNALDSRFLGYIPEDQLVGVLYKDH